MVRHIVMFDFLEEAEGRTKRENAQIAKERLEALLGIVPSLKTAVVHLNDKCADPANYDLVLITEHDDFEGLKAYATHPEHLKVGEFIGKVRKSRACVDFEI